MATTSPSATSDLSYQPPCRLPRRLSFPSCCTTGCTLSAPLPFSSSAFGSPAAPSIWSAALYRNPAISTKCCVAFSARSPAISSSRHSARGAVPIWHPDHQLSRRHLGRCLPGDRFGSTRHTLESCGGRHAADRPIPHRPFRHSRSAAILARSATSLYFGRRSSPTPIRRSSFRTVASGANRSKHDHLHGARSHWACDPSAVPANRRAASATGQKPMDGADNT